MRQGNKLKNHASKVPTAEDLHQQGGATTARPSRLIRTGEHPTGSSLTAKKAQALRQAQSTIPGV